MPWPYPPAAIEQAFQLWLKFNGTQIDRIEAEMRKDWPSWTKKNLFDRGDRQGWIAKYGWEKALQRKIQAMAEAGLTDAEALYRDVKRKRERLSEKIEAGTPSKDEQYIYRDYVRIEIELLDRLIQSHETLKAFNTAWEKILGWAERINPAAWRALLDISDAVLERAEQEYASKA